MLREVLIEQGYSVGSLAQLAHEVDHLHEDATQPTHTEQCSAVPGAARSEQIQIVMHMQHCH